MTQLWSRRALLGASLSALGTALAAEAPLTALRPLARPDTPETAAEPPLARPDAPPLRETLEEIIAKSGLGSDVAVLLSDTATGQVLDSHRAEQALPPASVTKVLTALYALAQLGQDYRFRTRILATGPVTNGVVQGDLILAGGADPTLDTDALAGMVDTLKTKGITGITGTFQVWGGLLPKLQEIEPSQLDHLGYNPAVSGLNLNFNRVHFEWRRAGADYRVTMQARTEAYRPDVAMAEMKVVDRRSPIYTFTDAGPVDRWTVARHALGDGGARLLPVREPALYAGDTLRQLTAAAGLNLPRPKLRPAQDAPKGTELAQHLSQKLLFILEDMLLYSTNLTAEVTGLMASRAYGDPVDTLEESAARMSGWLRDRYSIAASFVDHSGLSDANRISPDALVKVLNAAAGPGVLARILKTMPFLNDNRERISDHPGRVAAKTGTLNFVSALAGYVFTAHGRQLSFAILTADPAKRAASKGSQEDLPPGASEFNTRAKKLQEQLYRRWALMG